jgi:penicillin-binding protein 2
LVNRVVAGLYTPGSVFKPFMAVGALEQNIIDPNKQILSTGQISIQNPYDPTKKTVFKDWRANGLVDMRWAIAFSSDVYFYEIGGGYGDQKGLGITNIKKYAELFGLSHKTGINLFGEQTGVIPDPAWKKIHFDNEDWRLGDTYHTVIGQYGVQVTPLQILRGISAIANGGLLITPTLLYSADGIASSSPIQLPVQAAHLQIVREGMRLSVREGTNKGLNTPAVEVAAKTGTAELGESRSRVNSWVTGFFPYSNPRYAFVATLEKGSVHNLIGATYAMRQLLDWMAVYTPEYLKAESGS